MGRRKVKSTREVLHSVDPNLNIISGRRRPKKDDWGKSGGVFCSNCNAEIVRVFDGLCPQCFHKLTSEQEEALGRKREKNYLIQLFNKGKITLKQLKQGRLS